MERAVLVYTTYPSLVEAEKAGRDAVAQRLAACINILPGMVSHYWWEGKIERGEEVVMILKTRASLADRLRKALKASHHNTVPAIMVLPVESVEDTYLRWMMAETDRAAAVFDGWRPAPSASGSPPFADRPATEAWPPVSGGGRDLHIALPHKDQASIAVALPAADALILAVSHRQFLEIDQASLQRKIVRNGCVIDVKSVLDAAALRREGLRVWRL